MRKLLYMATLSLVGTLMFAPAAPAQDTGDCSVPSERLSVGDFFAPESFFTFVPAVNGCIIAEGQADPLIGQLSSTVYDAGTGEELGLLKDVDPNLADSITYEEFCGAFPTLDGQTAQGYYEQVANAQERAILDPEGDGVACNAGETTGAGTEQYGGGTEPVAEPTAAPTTPQPTATPQAGAGLPATGGPALFLLPAAGLLLLATGLAGLRVVRRS